MKYICITPHYTTVSAVKDTVEVKLLWRKGTSGVKEEREASKASGESFKNILGIDSVMIGCREKFKLGKGTV